MFSGPQAVIPSWEGKLGSICERLWILKHLPLWKKPPEWVKLASWLLYRWGNQVRPGHIGAPLWTKWAKSNAAFSLASLWPNDRNGLHSSKVLWILYLSRKTEAKNTILLAGIYEIPAWGFTFGDMCVFVWVCMREKGGNYSSTLGEQAISFVGLSNAP